MYINVCLYFANTGDAFLLCGTISVLRVTVSHFSQSHTFLLQLFLLQLRTLEGGRTGFFCFVLFSSSFLVLPFERFSTSLKTTEQCRFLVFSSPLPLKPCCQQSRNFLKRTFSREGQHNKSVGRGLAGVLKGQQLR